MQRLFPVLVVLFLGYLGFSLALPIFPPLFLDLKWSFLSPNVSTATRRILLGVLFAMYPMGQFLGAPMMGKLSDKYGRKPILLISLLSIIPGYVGAALSVVYQLPLLLFLSRFWVGLLEGNMTIAQAAITDIAEDEKTKIKNFSWMVSLSSSAFFFGPLIGGSLADSKLVAWFQFDTPFWFGALAVFVGFLIVWISFRETHSADQTVVIDLRYLLLSFFESVKVKRLQLIFAANLCFFLAIFFFLNFLSSYFLILFQFNVAQLGKISAYLAFLVLIAPLFFKLMARFWSVTQTAMMGSMCMGLSLFIFLFPSSLYALIVTLIPLGFFTAVGFAYPALMISNAVSKNNQGQALGANMAIQFFGEGATAIFGGCLAVFWIGLPNLMGGFFALIGGLILIVENKRSRRSNAQKI